jgi:hypothetical protein
MHVFIHLEATAWREVEEQKEVEAQRKQIGESTWLETRQCRKQQWQKSSGNRLQWGFQASNSPSQHLLALLV